jgi:hypothetical protein
MVAGNAGCRKGFIAAQQTWRADFRSGSFSTNQRCLRCLRDVRFHPIATKLLHYGKRRDGPKDDIRVSTIFATTSFERQWR